MALAVIRSEAELRSREAASFNPRMVRRIATGARDTLLTDDGLHHRWRSFRASRRRRFCGGLRGKSTNRYR